MKTMLLVDGNSILNRAFYGIRLMTDKDGNFTNAIYGLCNTLEKRMEERHYDYAVIAFDRHAPTFRKEMYADYKANRHGMPEELRAQLDGAKECTDLMGFHRLEMDGYEGDDIIGTVARMAEKEDVQVYILSGDRDLLQLISPRVSVILAGKDDLPPYDRDAFFAQYGIEPIHLIDVKALMGDSSDNIPGVPGVGEKSAYKLIATYRDLPTLYEHIDDAEIAKGLRQKLLDGREMADLSFRLAKICCEVPLSVSLADLVYRGVRQEPLKEKFISLQFNRLISAFGLDLPPLPTVEMRQSERPLYEYADAETILSQDGAVSAELQSETLYLHIGEKNFAFAGDFRSLSPLFDGSRPLFTYDGKSLFHALARRGLAPAGIPRDLALIAYAIDSNVGGASLSSLVLAYLGETAEEGEPCAHLFPRLAEEMMKRVDEVGSRDLLETVELPLSPLLFEMENAGFKIDRAGMEAFSGQLEKAIARLADQIYYLAGEEFSILSPKQLGHILFEKLGLPAEKKTKSGYSTDVDVLTHLRSLHPIVAAVLDYRQLCKLHATYAVGLLRVADDADRVHTDFKQALTATGRLSSAEPNLQNIPIRTELGREMRRYFIAEEGCVLIDADYSQIELRLLAHMSGDGEMTDAFRREVDIHRRTAALVFGVEEDAVTEEQRKRAKAVNFGIVYGIGPFSLSEDLGISRAQAKEYIESYFASYPTVKSYLQKTVEDAYKNGFVTTLFGRRRNLPELRVANKNTQKFGERVAMNSPLQGTAADIVKIAMLRVAARLKSEKIDARLVMQVHDELILEAKESDAARAKAILTEEMESAVSLSVPLTVDVTVSKTWLVSSS